MIVCLIRRMRSGAIAFVWGSDPMHPWYIRPARHLRHMAYHLCYARGMLAVSRDILSILQDDDFSLRERLQEVVTYHREGVLYKPRKALPERRPYLPKEEMLTGDKLLLLGASDDELRHGYILGKRKACEVIHDMIILADDRTEEEIYHSVIVFCEAVIEVESVR